jgi:hypothetical protein
VVRVLTECTRLGGVELGQGTPCLNRRGAPRDVHERLMGQRREKVPKDSLVPSDPRCVGQVLGRGGSLVDVGDDKMFSSGRSSPVRRSSNCTT